MPRYEFTESEALDLLAAAVCDTLDELFSEGELDDDSGPPQTALYNLASALGNRRSDAGAPGDGHRHAQTELNLLVEYRADAGSVSVVWKRLREKIGLG